MTFFAPDETRCKCGCGFDILKSQRDTLDALRDAVGFPLIVVSGARCQRRNRLVGGATDSMHLRGLATDIQLPSDPAQRWSLLHHASQMFSGIGVYDTFLHVDRRDLANRPHSMWVDL